jgi:hypothetical protein
MATQTNHNLIHFPLATGLSEEITGESRDLMVSDSVEFPFGWLFLFGSRNIWEPGETLKARGGAAAERNPAITPMEAAEVRLHEATQTLLRDPDLAPIGETLGLLDRVLKSAGSRGQLRLSSPPKSFGRADSLEEKRRRLMELVAMGENVVYYLGQGNRTSAIQALKNLEDRCAFVPTTEWSRDVRTLKRKAKSLNSSMPLEVAAVRLLIGWPSDPRIAEAVKLRVPAVLRQVLLTPPAPDTKRPWWAFWK